jgi:hypothetical protein
LEADIKALMVKTASVERRMQIIRRIDDESFQSECDAGNIEPEVGISTPTQPPVMSESSATKENDPVAVEPHVEEKAESPKKTGVIGKIPVRKEEARNGEETIELTAPAGQLEITVDSSADGAIVHKIRPGSPMEGILSPGDIIVLLGGVSMVGMLEADIKALMVKTASVERSIQIIRWR